MFGMYNCFGNIIFDLYPRNNDKVIFEYLFCLKEIGVYIHICACVCVGVHLPKRNMCVYVYTHIHIYIYVYTVCKFTVYIVG